MIDVQYCHLCRVDASATHAASPRHRAARQIAAVAVERLSNHVACEVTEDVPETVGETGDAIVSFCDSCNVTVSTSEFTSHQRQKDHMLNVLNEQNLEELVRIYVDGEDKLLEEPSDAQDNSASINQAQAVKTYACHVCALVVPLVFKTEHARGARHRASRTLAVSVARRLRDTLGDSADKTKRTSEPKTRVSEDKTKDISEDAEEKPRFSSKMMKKLLKNYTRRDVVDYNKEEAAEEAEPTKTERKRLTAKKYFSDILPFLPYAGSFHTLIVDDTEFVTIQIGSDSLKIHVNNINGLHNYGDKDVTYTLCRLCDGFDHQAYSSYEERDKLHVMSLGHIRNLLTPFDNVHLIRKIDETYSTCALCNVQISSHGVDNHIMKDLHHTTALAKAMELGKGFKESKEQIKIMVFSPPAPKPGVFMKPSQFNNGFKWPLNQDSFKRHTGVLFGGAQNNVGFGSAHNNVGFGSAQYNVGFGSAQNSFGFGSANNNVGFGSAHNNVGFGSAQSNVGFGSARNTGSIFGDGKTVGLVAQNSVGFDSTQNNKSLFGSPQKATGIGAQNQKTAFGTAQNNAVPFGSAQNTSLGAIQNNSFQNVQNPVGFGVQSKTSAFGINQNNGVPFGSTQNTTGFGAAQNNPVPFGTAQNTTGFGAAQNNPVPFGSGQNTTGFGAAQNNPVPFGTAQNTNGFGAAPNNLFGNVQDPVCFGAQNKISAFGTAQIKPVPFGTAQNTAVIDTQNRSTGFGTAQSNTALGNDKNSTRFGCGDQTGIGNAQIFGNTQNVTQSKTQSDSSNSSSQINQPSRQTDNAPQNDDFSKGSSDKKNNLAVTQNEAQNNSGVAQKDSDKIYEPVKTKTRFRSLSSTSSDSE